MAQVGNEPNIQDSFIKRTWRRIKIYVNDHKKPFFITLAVTYLILCLLFGAGHTATQALMGETTKFPSLLYGVFSVWTYIVLLILLCVYFFVVLNMKETLHEEHGDFNYTGDGTLGSARFMNEDEKLQAYHIDTPENLNEEGRTILGWNLDSKDRPTKNALASKDTNFLNGHSLIMGGSGQRKTTTVLLNLILSAAQRGESIICSDPKGELVAYTKVLLQKLGYTVKILNLKRTQNSDCIDFLAGLRSTAENEDDWLTETITNATVFAQTVMKNTKAEGKEDYWYDNEEAILEAAIIYELTRTDKVATWRDVYQDIQLTAEEFDTLINSRPPTDPCVLACAAFHENMQGDKADVSAAIISGLKSRLKTFINPSILRVCSTDEIDLELAGKQKCAYFILSPDQNTTMDFIKSMFFAAAFTKLVAYADDNSTRTCDVRVNFMLEEAKSVGAIYALDTKLSNIRSRNIGITLCFQTIGQIEDLYPENAWKDIVAECDLVFYLGGNDSTDTADYFLNRYGYTTAQSAGFRRSRNILNPLQGKFMPEYMENVGQQRRELQTIDEILRQNLDILILFMKAKRPCKIGKFHYSNHPMSKYIDERPSTDHIPDWKRKELDMPTYEEYGIPDEELIAEFKELTHLRSNGYDILYPEFIQNKADWDRVLKEESTGKEAAAKADLNQASKIALKLKQEAEAAKAAKQAGLNSHGSNKDDVKNKTRPKKGADGNVIPKKWGETEDGEQEANPDVSPTPKVRTATPAPTVIDDGKKPAPPVKTYAPPQAGAPVKPVQKPAPTVITEDRKLTAPAPAPKPQQEAEPKDAEPKDAEPKVRTYAPPQGAAPVMPVNAAKAQEKAKEEVKAAEDFIRMQQAQAPAPSPNNTVSQRRTVRTGGMLRAADLNRQGEAFKTPEAGKKEEAKRDEKAERTTQVVDIPQKTRPVVAAAKKKVFNPHPNEAYQPVTEGAEPMLRPVANDRIKYVEDN